MRAGASEGRRRRRRSRSVSSIGSGRPGSDQPEADAASEDGVPRARETARLRADHDARTVGACEIEPSEPFAAAVVCLHEAEPGIVERDDRVAVLIARQGKLHDLAPAAGKPLRIVTLQLGGRHGPNRAATSRRRGLRCRRMPGTVGRLTALLVAERQHGGTYVARMKLQLVVVAVRDLVRDTNAGRLAPRTPRRQIGTLGDDHVAAVAAPPLEIAPGGGAFLDRGDHFEEAVADGKQRVLEPVLPHPGVAEAHLETEDILERIHDGRQLFRDQTDLPHAQVHGRCPRYRLAMGSSSAGKSVMIWAPFGVTITSSSMRAAETPSAAGQYVSTAKTMPARSSMGSSSEFSREMIGRSWRPSPRPWQKLSPNAAISLSKPISCALGKHFAMRSVETPGLMRAMALSIHSRAFLYALF